MCTLCGEKYHRYLLLILAVTKLGSVNIWSGGGGAVILSSISSWLNLGNKEDSSLPDHWATSLARQTQFRGHNSYVHEYIVPNLTREVW
jgi:hypothetical protein